MAIFFGSAKRPYIFLFKKKPLVRSPVNAANCHILKTVFKIPNSRIFYNFTPLIWPLVRSNRLLQKFRAKLKGKKSKKGDDVILRNRPRDLPYRKTRTNPSFCLLKRT